MTGTNTITFNAEQMKEALEYYLNNKVFSGDVSISKVEYPHQGLYNEVVGITFDPKPGEEIQ